MSIRLAENIKYLRESRMITQSELADVLYVTPQSVSRWENGMAYPDIEKLPDIARYFGVTIDELIGSSAPRVVVLFDRVCELRADLRKEYSTDTLKKLCDAIKKLIDEGDENFIGEYFVHNKRLFREGVIDSEQMDEAREYCQKTLSSLKGDRLPKVLSVMVSNEDEEHKAKWSKFITKDNYLSSWNDVLLMSYQMNDSLSDQFEKQRQLVMFEDIKKIIYMLSYETRNVPNEITDRERVYANCRAACEIISIFSERIDDIFLSTRVWAEYSFAKACFLCGKNEEGFMMLETLREHLLISKEYYINGSEYYGSDKTFDLHSVKGEIFGFGENLAHMFFGDSAFDEVREDKRFIDFCDHLNELSFLRMDDEFSSINVSDLATYKKLYAIAEQQIDINQPTSDYSKVVVLLSEKGNVYKHIIGNVCSDDDSDERELIRILKKNGDTKIEKIVAMFFNNKCIDHISYRLKKMLCDLNRKNIYAEMLVNGIKGYVVCEIGKSINRYDRLRYTDE